MPDTGRLLDQALEEAARLPRPELVAAARALGLVFSRWDGTHSVSMDCFFDDQRDEAGALRLVASISGRGLLSSIAPETRAIILR